MADAHDRSVETATTHADEHHEHVVPLKLLVGVFVALMVLTVVTVAVTYVDLGEFNFLVALLIALVKAALVAMIFMHLWWDSRFNGIALISALAFVALFIGISIIDAREYKPNIQTYRILNPQQIQMPANLEASDEGEPSEAGEGDSAAADTGS